jgi:uroporphyrinogen decarboxylase
MTSRERVRRILEHREADRPAIDLGSTRMTGMTAWTYGSLKEALGLPPQPVRAFDLFQMIAEVERPVLDALSCDFEMFLSTDLPLGTTYGSWKPFTFWTGQTFQVPADFSPRIGDDGSLEAPREKGGPIEMRMPAGGRFFDKIPDEGEDIFDVEFVPESDWDFPEELDESWLAEQEARARALFESTDRAVVASPPVGAPQGYGNLYWWAMQMLSEPQYCTDYMQRHAEAGAKRFAQYLDAVGDYVDVVVISGYDYGGQSQEMFNPDLFAEHYVPAWKKVTDVIHRYDGVKTWVHSCGAVAGFIPHFIEAGVDCLNPVQWTAAGMELEKLKRSFGDQLTFWGGSISTQRTFPFGTPEEVAAEVTSVLDIMAPAGGYVVNPIHNILPEVPVENIVAMYRTAAGYRQTARAR